MPARRWASGRHIKVAIPKSAWTEDRALESECIRSDGFGPVRAGSNQKTTAAVDRCFDNNYRKIFNVVLSNIKNANKERVSMNGLSRPARYCTIPAGTMGGQCCKAARIEQSYVHYNAVELPGKDKYLPRDQHARLGDRMMECERHTRHEVRS
jgi:hypothetical protein